MHIYIYKHMEVKVRRTFCSLHWRHNDHDGVLNHQPHGCLLNLLFQRRSKKNIKVPRHWPLCGEFTVAGEFPAQRDSDVENASIWWRHHGYNVSDHHVKSDTEQCCNNWRICLLNEPMEVHQQWSVLLCFARPGHVLGVCHMLYPIHEYNNWHKAVSMSYKVTTT